MKIPTDFLPDVPEHLQHSPEKNQIRIDLCGEFCRVRDSFIRSRRNRGGGAFMEQEKHWMVDFYSSSGKVRISEALTEIDIRRTSWLVGHFFKEQNPFLPKATERILYQYPPDQKVYEALFFEQDLIGGPSMLVLSSIRTIAERAVIMSPSAEALLHASIVPARAAIIPPDYYPTDPSDAPGPSPLVTCFGCQGTGGDSHNGICRTCGGTGSVKRRDRQDTPAFPSYPNHSPFPSRYQESSNADWFQRADIKIMASEAVPKDEAWLVDAIVGVDPGAEGSDRSLFIAGPLRAGDLSIRKKLIEAFRRSVIT